MNRKIWPSAAVIAFLAGNAGAAPLVFTPYHADGHYHAGETVGWTVTPGGAPQKGSYSYTVIEDEKVDLERGSFDLATGSARIEIPAVHDGRLCVIVDYMAPPPPPPPSPALLQQINAAMRALVLKTDPSLKDVLDKYPDYQFVHRGFDFRMFEEDRVAMLTARVGQAKK